MTTSNFKVMGIAAASGKVGMVILRNGQLLEWKLSKVASRSPARVQQVVQGWLDLHKPDAVITELKIIEAAAHRLARSKIIHKQAISGWDALVSYCRTAMAHRETEQFRVLFLYRKNVLIADEEQARGTIDHVPVYPREVVKRALALNASAIILVHNHPSGDPTPSDADITVTRLIEDAARALSITLHDHLIIGAAEEFSFRSAGYL